MSWTSLARALARLISRPPNVAEIIGLLRTGLAGDALAGWSVDMRLIVRRERPHPGAQLSLFEQREGFRFPVTATTP